MAESSGRGPLVLGYHNIEPTWSMSAQSQGGEIFERQLRALRRVCHIIPLDHALAALSDGSVLPPRAVVITFDDGYRDNLQIAVPVLQSLGLSATFYLVPGFLSGVVHAWWERLGWALSTARASTVDVAGKRFEIGDRVSRAAALRSLEVDLKRHDHETRHALVEGLVEAARPAADYRADELFLNWDGARALVEAGMSIGSHTMDHAILAREDDGAQRGNLARSRTELQQHLGVGVDTLAYPNGEVGDYDRLTVGAAREAGYTSAVTTWGRTVQPGAPYEVSRKIVSTRIPPARLVTIVLRNLYAHRLPAEWPWRRR